MSTIDCVSCRTPCEIRPDGSVDCLKCHRSAVLQDNGRWKVYVPTWRVPHGPPLKWYDLTIDLCTPNPARLGPVLYGDGWETLN